MAKCFIGLHKYEVIKEVEVKDVDTDTVVGINIGLLGEGVKGSSCEQFQF